MHERLETDRLLLRMFGNDDLDPYYAICSDPEVMEFIRQGKTMNRLDACARTRAPFESLKDSAGLPDGTAELLGTPVLVYAYSLVR